MISKGLDFENVTLVGIIAADTALNLPDYRSPEKTFQLITQVAGRAGRGEIIRARLFYRPMILNIIVLFMLRIKIIKVFIIRKCP